MIRVVTNEVKLKSKSALRKPRPSAPRDAPAGGPIDGMPPGGVAAEPNPACPGAPCPGAPDPGALDPGRPCPWAPWPGVACQIGAVAGPGPAAPAWPGVPGAGRAAPAP